MSRDFTADRRREEKGPPSMTTTDTTTDTAQLEAAEDKLERAMNALYRIADEVRPKRVAAEIECLVDDLNDALDCLQLGLGRPYVWLLSR
jgi:hypothetical protein